ncbi:winged helix DNA-binding domain-containing protein [Streptomyces sp. Je 1-79]|uniref:winged helix DNA-binding domain-containing protein n=1 Tax=Streptomyces sp. Je 1-79 TaxID=2943847 RepID=UPI0021A4F8FF|nr:winged helix DNA-binding domain-containing protein [Streptomyces sp. Je 1-79]MCT4356678.1 winged helix DNA-binding domain-containing protein [Streptomyces sp. Je 1-79]
MKISARGLNRSTLARQLLLRRESVGAAEAVRRVVALQAQQPASPYLALWNRTAGFDPSELDEAFAHGTVVKSTLMRITLHAVHADDYRTFRAALHPVLRAGRLGDRYTASGLTPADADLLVPELLAFADRPRTNAEYEAWIEQRTGSAPKSGAWWGLRHYTPLLHAPTAPPWSFGERPSYVAPPDPPTPPEPEASDAALRRLLVRYLEGFGPASAADMAQFAMVQRARVREALRTLGDDLERAEGPDGEELFDVPGAPHPDEDVPAPPRLMAMWDSTLLAYADRGRVIPPDHRSLVIRRNGDVLPTLLVDGYVAGVWRPAEGGIEATAFHGLPDEAWEGLADEARSLTAFLADREPRVYRRYDHWWTKLPHGETRLLPGP